LFKKFKKIAAVTAAAGLLGLALSACSTAEKAATEADCGTEKAFCIGVVTDLGKVDDKSFNQAAWEGALAGAEATGGFAKYVETTDYKDYAKNIALFGDKGYNVIVTVGFLMAEATVAAAGTYPDVKFVGVDQFNGTDAANVTGLIFDEDRAGFLAGYLAGNLTKSDKIGGVLGMKEVPPVRKFGEGYEAGIAYAAKELGKTIKSSVIYHAAGDTAFNDPAWGASTASQLLGQGFDVIFGAGGNTGNGAITKVAQTAGTFCIGVDIDQWNTVPEAQPCLVTSAEKKLVKGVTDLIIAAKDGTIAAGNFVGQVGLSDYHDLSSAVSQEIQDKVSAITEKIISGELATGVKP
jgi:basic membrane protein A